MRMLLWSSRIINLAQSSCAELSQYLLAPMKHNGAKNPSTESKRPMAPYTPSKTILTRTCSSRSLLLPSCVEVNDCQEERREDGRKKTNKYFAATLAMTLPLVSPSQKKRLPALLPGLITEALQSRKQTSVCMCRDSAHARMHPRLDTTLAAVRASSTRDTTESFLISSGLIPAV